MENGNVNINNLDEVKKMSNTFTQQLLSKKHK